MLGKLAKSRSSFNLILLYIIRLLQMVFPLILLPFLSRRLTVVGFGVVVFSQAIGSLLGALIEYGFNYFGTRDLAQSINNKSRFSEIFNLVLSSKVFLSVLSFFLLNIILYFNKTMYPYILPIMLIAISSGFSPYWAFQATGNIIPVAINELINRMLLLLAVLIIPSNSLTPGVYIFIFSIFSLIGNLVTNYIFVLQKDIRLSFLVPFAYLAKGFNMFIFRVGAIAYSSGSLALLGTVVGSTEIAIFGGAERFFRAAAGMTGPVGDFIFPRISHLQTTDPDRARQMQRLGSIGIIIFSLIIAATLFFLSRFIVAIFLGPKYIDSVAILKILSLNVLLIGIGTAVGVIYLIPKGLDRIFSIATVTAGIWNVFSIFVLVPKLGLLWMAWTLNITEAIVILVCLYGLNSVKRRSHAI